MICVSIAETDINKCKKILQESPMAELRADLCKFSANEIEELVSSHSNLIITCRAKWPIYNSSNSEQEYTTGIEKAEALKLIISAIKRGAKYVDIEIEADENHLEYIKAYAKANSCKLIISYHNYVITPSKRDLEEIYTLCKRKGADLVKIATMANSTEDAARVLSLYKSVAKVCNSTPLIAFAMGEKGKFTRLSCIKLGSPYSYCSYKNMSTALGQYSKQEMEQALLPTNYPFMILGGSLCADTLSYNSCNASTDNTNTSTLDNLNTAENTIYIPCSKSISQRAIIAAALAKGETILENYSPCNDSKSALELIENIGCSIKIPNKENLSSNYCTYTLKINSPGVEQLITKQLNNSQASKEPYIINVGESGFLARLFCPLASYLSEQNTCDIVINGKESLLRRDLSDAVDALNIAGAKCKATNNGHIPLTISSGMNNYDVVLDGSLSSQTISGFLFTLPLLSYDSKLSVKNVVSTPYINLSIQTLEHFGIEITKLDESDNNLVFYIKGKQKYKACKLALPSDWSSAAYFVVAAALGKDFKICNLPLNSLQADEAILDVMKLCKANLNIEENNATVSISPKDISIKPKCLNAFDFDATNCPDLFPILATLAMFCNGKSKIYGLHRLSEKESNRCESIFSQLSALGADLQIEADSLIINAPQNAQQGINTCSKHKLHGAYLSSYNDHRIAMSLIIASFFIPEPLFLDNIACINKSFPAFLEMVKR